MDAIRKKLKNSTGASILMALLLLLVAVMVSAVILAAAISASKTIRSDREQQQTYLTVSSAAELLRDSVVGGSGNFQLVETTKVVQNEIRTWQSSWSSWSSWRQNGNPVTTTTSGRKDATGNFSSVLNTAIQSVMQNPTLTYTATVTIQDTAKQYDRVTAELSLEAEANEDAGTTNYVLTAVFTGGEGDHLCRMTLTLRGQEQQETTGPETETKIGTSEWNRQTRTTTTTTTTTTSIDWSGDTAKITRERVASN